MSQVTKLVRVRHHGAPAFLGYRTVTDERGNQTSEPQWSADPETVVRWMASGFRFRFNQRRSLRHWHLTCLDRNGKHTRVTDPAGQPVLVPIGYTVTDITDAQARQAHPHPAALPEYVIGATRKTEADDWYSATRRRRTNRAAGRRPGRMPRFRSAKTDDDRFVCWFNGGRNALFTRTGRRSGMVTISGMNPGRHSQRGQKQRWQITLHVRLSQPIRPYTSVRVNLTRDRVVFVNEPLPVGDRTGNGDPVGIDRGVVHSAADSTGVFHDAPATKDLERSRRWHHKRMSKSRLVAERQGRQFRESNGYRRHKIQAARVAGKIARIRKDFAHKLSTRLVREFDLIGIEDLRLPNMTRKGRGNRGLNRVMHAAALGRVAEFIQYKTRIAGIPYVPVNPAYTSQRCHRCGHTAKENRESQAVFRCSSCAYTGNADTNAAINIRDAALELWLTGAGQDTAQAASNGALAGSKGKTDPREGPALVAGGTCYEPRTTRNRRTTAEPGIPPL